MPDRPAATDPVGASTTKWLRYGAVTVVNVVLGLATLVFLHGFLGMAGVAAAVLAVVGSAVPCFVLNRRFVWHRFGRIRVRAELVPFALFTVAGLLLSSVLVFLATRRFDGEATVYVAHQSAFAVIWVLRFFFFDRLLWKPRRLSLSVVRALPDLTVRRRRPAVDDLAA